MSSGLRQRPLQTVAQLPERRRFHRPLPFVPAMPGHPSANSPASAPNQMICRGQVRHDRLIFMRAESGFLQHE